MNWNPVLNKVLEIKRAYQTQFGVIDYNYKDIFQNEHQTCLDRWIEELNTVDPGKYQEYKQLFFYLETNQYKHLLLIRYVKHINFETDDFEFIKENLWSIEHGFYRECRSVVIDLVKECIVLCPFRKFFNINELEETNLENIKMRMKQAKTIEFSDKLDGSMQSATWYQNQIVMAGSQSLDPALAWRLEDGYKKIHSLPGYETMLKDHPDMTFIFEYISLKDAHVVKYTKEQEGLYLIGMRNNENGTEYSYQTILNMAHQYQIPTTKVFDKTLDVVMTELDEKKSEEAEGFVINIDGYKVKLKYNDYIHIHRVLSKLSSVNLVIQSIADDQYDDLISKIPMAYRDNVQKIAAVVWKYDAAMRKQVKIYYDKAPKTTQKEFMCYVDKQIPRQYRSYCKSVYYGKDYNVLKRGSKESPKYIKLKEMGVKNYADIFAGDVDNE